MTSMVEYLTDIRTHGARPIAVGRVTIGRTYYTAGTYLTAERETLEGSRARQEGQQTIPPELAMVLMPTYATNDPTGPEPKLLPASYRRSHQTLYRSDQTGQLWYVAAWNDREGWLQMRPAPQWLVEEQERDGRPVQVARFGGFQAFDSTLRLSEGGPVWPDLERKLRGVVRHIAADWHGGQITALCSFATTGAVALDDLTAEIDAEIQGQESAGRTNRGPLAHPDTLDLFLLRAYVRNVEERGPVEGWSQVWAG